MMAIKVNLDLIVKLMYPITTSSSNFIIRSSFEIFKG